MYKNNSNKNVIKLIILIIISLFLYFLIKNNYYVIQNSIESFYTKVVNKNIKQYLYDNEYKKGVNYEYVNINKNTIIKNKDDIKNAIYTYLDSGWDKYIITCDDAYTSCINDFKETVENKEYLTNLSNFVHPFNTFEEFNSTISNGGKLTLSKKNRYDNETINNINLKVDELYSKLYDHKKNVKENIKIFHDYIINNTIYDTENTSGASNISSSTAYGVLFDGKGICSGYSDAMQLFLEKLSVPNYRVSSESHVWNLAYVEGKWLHIDLTWDDPITNDGKNNLSDDYFLIDNHTLQSKNDNEHFFNSDIYSEAK